MTPSAGIADAVSTHADIALRAPPVRSCLRSPAIWMPASGIICGRAHTMAQRKTAARSMPERIVAPCGARLLGSALVTYQDPLAYLIGLEGMTLLDSWTGHHDRAFVEARLAEVRRLLDDKQLQGIGVEAETVSADVSYQQQAPDYDAGGGGGLFALDEPIITQWVEGRRAGDALDAACGTGRFAGLLAARGHTVVGVDGSPDMLDHARLRVPGADFRLGSLDALPVAEASADIVACGLALVHVPDLAPVFAEFARVLRPGGDLLISDIHPELTRLGSGIKGLGPNGGGRADVPSLARQLSARGAHHGLRAARVRGTGGKLGWAGTRRNPRTRRMGRLAMVAHGIRAGSDARRIGPPEPRAVALP